MQFYGKASENVMTPAAGQLCGWCMTANGVISILFASGLYTIKLLLFLHPPLSLSLSLAYTSAEDNVCTDPACFCLLKTTEPQIWLPWYTVNHLAGLCWSCCLFLTRLSAICTDSWVEYGNEKLKGPSLWPCQHSRYKHVKTGALKWNLLASRQWVSRPQQISRRRKWWWMDRERES